ncbi:hypothetical protein LJK87_40855 [Paenibacillus sp. P25]|nr:hypothetical protein LJK87_40855 [Paenibacillus sp. P25]
MNGTAAAVKWETEDAPGDYGFEGYGDQAAGEHDECGGTAFYPLSPVHQALFYCLLPEISSE